MMYDTYFFLTAEFENGETPFLPSPCDPSLHQRWTEVKGG